MTATTLFENTMKSFRDDYAEHRFSLEHDIVEPVYLYLLQEVRRCNLPYCVDTEHQMLGSKYADLVILNDDRVEVAAEFKYEPSHDRSNEFSAGKFDSPVVSWTGADGSVEEDVRRVNTYVKKGKVTTAYAILIDEGGYFYRRHVSPPREWRSEWRDWGNGVCVLWTKVTRP